MWRKRLGYRPFAAALVVAAGCSGHFSDDGKSANVVVVGSGEVDAGTIGSDGGPGSDGGIVMPPDAGSGSGSCMATYEPPPPAPPDPPNPPVDPGPEPDQCTYDICEALASGQLSPSQVSQPTLDECNGVSPAPSTCTFTPVSNFFDGAGGCNVVEQTYGDLGDYRYDCPTDPYEQQALCAYAVSTLSPIPAQIDPELWGGGAGSGSGSGSQTSPNEYTNPMPNGANRNVVVIGSSMLATHNQVNNGPKCWGMHPTNGTVLTSADDRGLVGSDFRASPAWHTRVPWLKVFRGARTGHTSDNVVNATSNPRTNDGCGYNWNENASPMNAGIAWFAGKNNRLMITDGGLINDQENVDGHSWPETLSGIVVCQALDNATGAVNTLLDWDHWAMNWFWNTCRQNGRVVARQAPQVVLQRSVPGAGKTWADALDINNVVRPRCQYVIKVRGNCRMPLTLNAVLAVAKDVSPLKRLWPGVPANNPVKLNLAAIKAAYVGVSKQIWVQYPYMEKAQVAIRGSDAALFWPGGAGAALIRAIGRNTMLTMDAIDNTLKPRMKQVTDDLNELMYDQAGCPAAQWAKSHGAIVCQRDNAMNPIVVITESDFAMWGAADHQNTIIGGMPHESPAGANKIGAAIVTADNKP